MVSLFGAPDVPTVGVVEQVNADGTVNVRVRGSVVTSLPAAPSYAPRAVGDRVEVRFAGGLGFVLGRRAGALPEPAQAGRPWEHVLVNAAPSGGSWVETLSGVWVDPVARIAQYVRSVPAPPAPTLGSLTRVAAFGTYSGGRIIGSDRAEQGAWAGYGPYVGLFVYGPGAWAPLAGKAITAVRVRLHRMDRGGDSAAAGIRLGLHPHASLPGEVTETTITGALDAAFLQRNGTATFTAPVAWGQALRDGTAAGLGINGLANAELDLATVTVDFTS